MAKNKLSKHEYYNIQSARKPSASSKNYAEAKVLFKTISEIQSLLPNNQNKLYAGSYGLRIQLKNTSRKADTDNIAKAINDALQGTAYDNDRNCEALYIFRCGFDVFQ